MEHVSGIEHSLRGSEIPCSTLKWERGARLLSRERHRATAVGLSVNLFFLSPTSDNASQ